MKKTKTSSSISIAAAVLAVIAVGLLLASVITEAAHAQTTNATQGGSSANQSTSNSTNPLAKVPMIGKLFGGK
jgi:hypothetical protein